MSNIEKNLAFKTYRLVYFLRKSQVSNLILNEYDYKKYLAENNQSDNGLSYDEYLIQNLKIQIKNGSNARFLDSVENERDYLDLIERERILKDISIETAKSLSFKEELIEKTMLLIDEHKSLPTKYQDTEAKEAGRKFLAYLIDEKCILKNQIPQIFKDDIGYTIFVKMSEKYDDTIHSQGEFYSCLFLHLQKKKHLSSDSYHFIKYVTENIDTNKSPITRIRNNRNTLKYDKLLKDTLDELSVNY